MTPPTPTQAKTAILAFLTTVLQVPLSGTVDLAVVRGQINTWITTYAPEIHSLPDYATNILPSFTQSIYQALIQHCTDTPFTIPGMVKFLDVLPQIDNITWLQPTLRQITIDHTFTNPNNGIIYVDHEVGNDLYGTGSADSPFGSIQAAINAITNSSIQTIQVAGGVYNEDLSLGEISLSIVGVNPREIEDNGQPVLPTQIIGSISVGSNIQDTTTTLKNLQIIPGLGFTPIVLIGSTGGFNVNLQLENCCFDNTSTPQINIQNQWTGCFLARKCSQLFNNGSALTLQLLQSGAAAASANYITIEDCTFDSISSTDNSNTVTWSFRNCQINTVSLASYQACYVDGCILYGNAGTEAWTDTANSGTVIFQNTIFQFRINKSGSSSYGIVGCSRLGTGDTLSGSQVNGILLDDIQSTNGLVVGRNLVSTDVTQTRGNLQTLESSFSGNSIGIGSTNAAFNTADVTGAPHITFSNDPTVAGSYSVEIGTSSAETNAYTSLIAFLYRGATVATISPLGVYAPPSDAKLKTNIKAKKPRKDLKNLKKIIALPVSSFSMKTDKAQQRITGFIAQDLEKILKRGLTKKIIKDSNNKNIYPTYQENETRYVDYNEIQACFILAFQEYVHKCDLEIQDLKDEISLIRKGQLNKMEIVEQKEQTTTKS